MAPLLYSLVAISSVAYSGARQPRADLSDVPPRRRQGNCKEALYVGT